MSTSKRLREFLSWRERDEREKHWSEREREWSPNREERGLIKKSERINK